MMMKKKYRFTYLNAVNGIILTSTVENPQIIPLLKQDIQSFVISTDKRFFQEAIEVEFYELKLNSEI